MSDLREELVNLFKPMEKKASDSIDELMSKEAAPLDWSKFMPQLKSYASKMPGHVLGGLKTGIKSGAKALGNLPGTVVVTGAGLGGAALIHNRMQASNKRALAKRLDISFERMYEEYPTLKNIPVLQAKRAFDVLAKMAPDLADSPTIAGAYVMQSMESPELDYMTFNPTAVGHLAQTQQALSKGKSTAVTGQLDALGKINKFMPGM